MPAMLREDAGFSRSLLLTLAVIAGVSVANLYYNQPLLEMLRTELRTSTLEANHIALFTQGGYALGLFFIIPLADLVSRRRIVLVNFSVLVLSLLAIAAALNIVTIQFFSFLTGLCSVMPHIFIPFAAQYSRPADKSRNVGIILSGLLSGILASRVVSGAVGEVLGWREMYCIAAGLMVLSALVILRVLPDTPRNFTGGYGALMRSLATLFRRYAALRLHALRAALAFGSFMCFWASLAFKMAEAPFHAGSDVVGLLGLCGIAGAVTASRVGVYIPRFSVRRLSAAGSLLQLVAWGALRRRGRELCGHHCRHRTDRHRHAGHPALQPDASFRARAAGLEPHQHALHEHLLHRRRLRHAPLGADLEPLGMAGRRGGRCRAGTRLAAHHPPAEAVAATARQYPLRHPDRISSRP